MMTIFLDPLGGPKRIVAVPPAAPTEPAQPADWRTAAQSHSWEEAILGKLRERPRQLMPLMAVANEIVGESLQPTRRDVRAATVEVLATICRLRKDRRIFRWKRKEISSLDPG